MNEKGGGEACIYRKFTDGLPTDLGFLNRHCTDGLPTELIHSVGNPSLFKIKKKLDSVGGKFGRVITDGLPTELT